MPATRRAAASACRSSAACAICTAGSRCKGRCFGRRRPWSAREPHAGRESTVVRSTNTPVRGRPDRDTRRRCGAVAC
ncbi:hypothetical protein G6F24_018195 [Rhizopus arrhizus]|nr:hypothetical protein G6F24_018195 [Rhizopus arrhizus]